MGGEWEFGRFDTLIFRLWSIVKILAILINILQDLFEALLAAVWIMFPAYLPNPVAAMFGGGRPIDGKRLWSDGNRILGDGKTYRGFLAGVLGGVLVGSLQIVLQPSLPWSWVPQHTLLTVLAFAVGALTGDLIKSFFKRRWDKARGEAWPVADQYDLVVGGLGLVALVDPSWVLAVITPLRLLLILVVTPLLHRMMNILGYITGIKDVPW